jgi:fructose-1,6-bisphosphatase I
MKATTKTKTTTKPNTKASPEPARGKIGEELRASLARSGSSDQDAEVARVIEALAGVARQIGALIAKGPLGGALGADTGAVNADGDRQKQLDEVANAMVLAALKTTSTAYFASEEEDAILTLDPNGRLAVAVDPLDGSSNIDVNVSIGTIFSIFAASPQGATASLFRPGHEQLAAGYFVYGPHTALVLTTGKGVDLFVLDQDTGGFRLARAGIDIPSAAKEFAINASNYRHWFDPIRIFIDDCIAGAEGPRGKDFNMRWVASLVAETHRIFSRGGVFLYPGDRRPGYERGRLRLIYEAAPIALLVEQAHGAANDGRERILDKVPTSLHERTPLVFGSAEKVRRIATYHTDPDFMRQKSPLFGDRGLFRN